MILARSLAAVTVLAAMAGPHPDQSAASSGDAVTIDARVVDRLGAPVVDLAAADFDVSVDGRRRQVISAEYEAESGTQQSAVVVVADRENLHTITSRSTLDAAAAFIERLPPSHTVGSLVLPMAKPAVEIGANRAAVIAALRRTVGTYDPKNAMTTDALALRNALHVVIGRLSATPGRRTIVYLSDRLEQTVNITDLAQRASLSGVVFYIVAADAPMTATGEWPSLAMEGERDSLVALAFASGGAMLRPIARAEAVFDRLSRELSGQYVVRFAADASDTQGRRALKIAVKRPGLSVRARREFVR